MNRLRRVITNTLISLLGQAVTWTSTFLLTIAYGRFLGDSKFGELYFAITFVSLIAIPLDTGNNNQIIRAIAQEPDKALRYFSSVLIIKLFTWPIVYAIALLAVWLLGYPMEVRMLVGICGFLMLSGTLANTFSSFHYAFERTIFPTVGLILEKGLSALFGFLLLKAGAGVEVMALVMLGGSLVSVVWQGAWFFRLAGIKFIIDLPLIRTIARSNVPFLISGILLMGYTNVDTILLSLMTNNATVGWYAAGTRIFDTLNFLPNIIIAAIMYPVFSRLSTTSDAALKMALEKSINFLLFCGIPISTGLLVAAPNLIGFLYHRVEFLHSILVMQLLAPGLIFIYMNYALVSIIMSRKEDKKLPILSLIALIFNVVLNLILIPLYLHLGAAFAASLTEILYFCVIITFIPRQLLPLGSLPVAFKSIIASLVMALAMLLLHTFSIFVLVPVAMFVYFGVAMLLGTIPREDYLAVSNAMRRKAQLVPSTAGQSSELEPGLSSEFTQLGRSDELSLVASSSLATETNAGSIATMVSDIPQFYGADLPGEDESEITLKLPRLRRQSMQQSLLTEQE